MLPGGGPANLGCSLQGRCIVPAMTAQTRSNNACLSASGTGWNWTLVGARGGGVAPFGSPLEEGSSRCQRLLGCDGWEGGLRGWRCGGPGFGPSAGAGQL